jgi:hypothetical protein
MLRLNSPFARAVRAPATVTITIDAAATPMSRQVPTVCLLRFAPLR